MVDTAATAEAAALNEHAAVRHQHRAAVVRAGHRGRGVQCKRLGGGVPDLCMFNSQTSHQLFINIKHMSQSQVPLHTLARVSENQLNRHEEANDDAHDIWYLLR